MSKSNSIKPKIEIQPIFLIGAMKCGTSSIFKHLELHPEICFPPIKEPEFFSENLGNPKYKVAKYLSLFNLTDEHKFIFDGSTGYTKYPIEKGVPKRIFEYGLRPKFIYVVRNPFDRVTSHYNFMRKFLYSKKEITSESYTSVSNYYMQLKQYEAYFPKSDILVVDFDELIMDYQTILKSIYDFVGIKEYFFLETNVQNNKTKAVNRTELKLKHKLKGRFNFIPNSIRSFVKKMLDKTFKKEMRRLTEKEINYIHGHLNSDMQKFQNEYGFDVSKWGF